MASLSKDENSCFESAIVDSFRCCLCLNVLRNPWQCQRNEHHFCKSCVTRHLKQSTVCPSCKEDLSLETLRPASQILTKLLSQLKIHCDYNRRGCGEVMKVEELEKHHKVCPFAPIVCSTKDCNEVVNRRDQVSHKKVCQFRLVNCSVCGENLVFRWYKMHACVLRSELEEVKSSVKRIEDSVAQILAYIKPIDCLFQGIKRNIIVCGGRGCSDAEVYEWKTRRWTRQKQQLGFTLECGSSFLYKGELIVTGVVNQGSQDHSDALKEIAVGENFAEAQWKTSIASLPSNCYGHTTVLVRDNLFVFGGYQSSILNGVYEIQLVTPFKSKLLGRMPEPRCHHGAGLFGDKVVIVGGQTEDQASNEVLMYDLAKNEWKKLAPLNKAVMKMATVCWKDNIILLGGQSTPDDSPDHSPDQITSEVVMYNITTEKCTTLPAMKQARSSCAAVITANTIVVIGGYGHCKNPKYGMCSHHNEQQYNDCDLNTVEYFSLEFDSPWGELSPMNNTHRGATACVV